MPDRALRDRGIDLEDPADDVTVWVTEVWTDAVAHKASLQLPAVKAVIAQALPLIAAFGEHRETRPVARDVS